VRRRGELGSKGRRRKETRRSQRGGRVQEEGWRGAVAGYCYPLPHRETGGIIEKFKVRRMWIPDGVARRRGCSLGEIATKWKVNLEGSCEYAVGRFWVYIY